MEDGALTEPETFGNEEENHSPYKKLSMIELHDQLEVAVQEEDYEKAARIRDEISKREDL
jgi:uncharacterized protein